MSTAKSTPATKKTAKKTPKKRGTARAKFADNVIVATGDGPKRFLPSSVRAYHPHNERSCLYEAPLEIAKWLIEPGTEYTEGMSVPCCFTLAEIEQRLQELIEEGQISDVEVSMSNTGQADLEVGYLRHSAFLLAEARGWLENIPRAKGKDFAGMRAKVVKAPVTAEDHAAKTLRNRHENKARKPLTDVDHAYFFDQELKRVQPDGSQLTHGQLAAREGVHVDYVNKRIRLLGCVPTRIREVHEGVMTMAEALKRKSKAGAGSCTGERGPVPGIVRGAMKRAALHIATRPPPTTTLTPLQLVQYTARIAGIEPAEGEKPDPAVDAWLAWADADKSVGKKPKVEKKAKEPKKTKAAPPKKDASAVDGDGTA